MYRSFFKIAGLCLFACLLTAVSGDVSAETNTTSTTSSYLGDSWETVSEIAHRRGFRAVACTNGTICIAVGDRGLLKRSSDQGNTWLDVVTPTTGDLVDIDCQASTCWALGYDFVMKSVDAGQSWSITRSDLVGGYYRLDCPSATRCIAIGPSYFMSSDDAGITWTERYSTQHADDIDVACIDAMTCLIVGRDGHILRNTGGDHLWETVSSPTTESIIAIDCFAATNCLAVGVDGVTVRSTDAGDTWQAVPALTDRALVDVVCMSPMRCIANSRGVIMGSDDGGASWHSMRNNYASVNALACPDVTTCVAVGDDAYIALSVDAGDEWLSVSERTLDNSWLNTLACPTEQTCFSLLNGLMAKSEDGGQRWLVEDAEIFSVRLTGIGCISAEICMATGYSGYKASTNDGGATWTGGSFNNSANFYNLACDNDVCFAIGQSGNIRRTDDGGVTTTTPPFVDTNEQILAIDCVTHCYAIDSTGRVLRSFNMGAQSAFLRKAQLPGTLGSYFSGDISCIDALTCVVNGTPDAPSYHSSDGGIQWLASAGGGGNAVDCRPEQVCISVGNNGRIERSSDSGTTWQHIVSDTTADLTEVDCASVTHCVAVGEWGTRLYSTDSGLTWQNGGQNRSPFMNGVDCPTVDICFSSRQTAANSAPIIKSTDGGQHWNTVGVIPAKSATLFCQTATLCLALAPDGEGRAFWRSVDAGVTWLQVATTTMRPSKIICTHAAICIASGEPARLWPSNPPPMIMRSSDLGASWSEVPAEAASFSEARDIACSNSVTCIIAGQGLPLSLDGGLTWSQGQLTTWFAQFNAIVCPDGNTCIAGGENSSTGAAVMMLSRDGGRQWDEIETSIASVPSMFVCASALTCFVLDVDGGLYRTSDGGVGWEVISAETDIDNIICPQYNTCLAFSQTFGQSQKLTRTVQQFNFTNHVYLPIVTRR